MTGAARKYILGDLTNEDWRLFKPMLPVVKGIGRSRKHAFREIMNGIRYVLRYGIPRDAMPKDPPPWRIWHDRWRLLSDGCHMNQINHAPVMLQGHSVLIKLEHFHYDRGRS